MSEVLGAGMIDFGSARLRESLQRDAVLDWARANWEVVLLLLYAAVVYQPWNSMLLPVTDFGTFLSERGVSGSVAEHFVNLTRYYSIDGRFCLVPYLDFALATKAFGVWPQGWYWMYFVINCGMLILARAFFLRTGVGRTAGMIALLLWATMSPTAEAWIRPTGEPFAMIFMLIALKLVHNYCDSTDWKRRGILVALCAVGIIYSKEVLVVLLPGIWLVSRLRFESGRWRWASWSPRDAFLFLVVLAATLLALVPVAYVALTAPQNNYASQYGHTLHPIYASLRRLESLAIPALPRLHRLINIVVDPGWTLLFVLPNLIWIRLVLGGLVAAKRRILWPAVVCVVWISLGLLVYSPWPITDEFYMLPFAFAAMFLGAHALTHIIGPTRTRAAAIIIASGILVVSSGVEGRTVVLHRQLRAKLYARVIDDLAVHPASATLIGATPEPAPVRRSWANNIKGFGDATRGLKISGAKDVSCADAKTALESRSGIVAVSTGWGCGKLIPNSSEIRESVPRYQWPWLWKRYEVEARMYVSRS